MASRASLTATASSRGKKKDKKRRRKKASARETQAEPAPRPELAGAGAAPRVDGNLNLRRQLRSIKMWKEIRDTGASSGGIGTTRKFRRTRDFSEQKREEREREEREEREERYSPVDDFERWMVQQRMSLSPIGLIRGGASSSAGATTLLVDGYNVVGQSKSLSALRDAGDLAAARLMLHESVDRFCHANRLSPMVVWDARTGVGRAAREEPHEHMRSLMVVYTVDADMWIESRVCRMLAGADQRQFESIWVATSDSLLAQCVFAQGAMVVSSRVFLEELAVTDNAAEILGGGARRARGPRCVLRVCPALSHPLHSCACVRVLTNIAVRHTDALPTRATGAGAGSWGMSWCCRSP